MDGFDAHEHADILAYCDLFDIIPSSHYSQPLDVGVYQAVKKAHQASLFDPVINGVLTVDKVDFLNNWGKIKKKGFQRSNIFKGWEKTGLWPLDPDSLLERLRQEDRERKEPMFPARLEEMTPRKATRSLQSREFRTQLRRNPPWFQEAVADAQVALDVAILTQNQSNKEAAFRKERLEDANNDERGSMYTTMPRPHLDAIAEVLDWKKSLNSFD